MKVPGQLWVGNNNLLEKLVIKTLQSYFCPYDGCYSCKECLLIEAKQHAYCFWVTPEKGYTRQDLEPVFEKIRFILEEKEQFFFIFPQADLLTPATGNSLLKTLEEPPAGYQFLFLTDRPAAIIPTISSRCVLFHKNESTDLISEYSALKEIIIAHDVAKIIDFSKIVDKLTVNHCELIALLDSLMQSYQKEYGQALINNNDCLQKLCQKRIACITDYYDKLPMPGSSKFFLRSLFLSLSSLS